MARIWRKPSVLMTAYLALFVAVQAWATTRSPMSASLQHVADMGSVPIAAFLTWRVTRGGWFSRGLIIVFTVSLMLQLLWGADLKSGGLVSLGAQCVALAQGFPVHFLSAVADGNFSSPVIYKAAAAEDMAIRTVLSFAACYLLWLPSRRPAEAAAARVAAPV
jgi:hypothetical protein